MEVREEEMKKKTRVLVKEERDIKIGETRIFGNVVEGIYLFRCTAKQDLNTPGRYFIREIDEDDPEVEYREELEEEIDPQDYWDKALQEFWEEQEYSEEQKEFGCSQTMMFYSANRKTVIEQAKMGNDVAQEVIVYYEQYIHRKDPISFGLLRNRLIVLHMMGKWNFK